jgi:hypothetical protein
MRCLSLTFLVVSLLATSSYGQEPKVNLDSASTLPPPVKVVIFPRSAKFPVLQQRLLPALTEQIDEDAAAYYSKAMLLRAESPTQNKQDERISEILDLPPDKFPLDEAREILKLQRSALMYVHLGAKRNTCRWAIPWRDQHEKLFSLVLPEIQQMRTIARVLQLEARVAVAEDRLDDALASIRAGYAAGRHVTTAPLFINGLVGVAITSNMQQELLRLLQHPAAPNLYWSLAALPQPLLDYRPAIEFEGDSLFIMFPEWKTLDQQRTTAEWDQLYLRSFGRLMKLTQELQLSTPETSQGLPPLASLAVISPLLYAQAKQHLADQGMEKSKIDALPMSQAILLYVVQDYQFRRDEIAKWMYLPLNEMPSMQTLTRHEQEVLKTRGVFSLAHLLLPSVSRVRFAYLRLERETNLLRAIEALRWHAALTGELPHLWKDVTAVPVPRDPWTGEPFRYQRTGDTALIEALAPDDTTGARHLRYELRLGKPSDIKKSVVVAEKTPAATADSKLTPQESLKNFLNPFASARQSARRAQSMNNLKQLGIAMYGYMDANQHYPAAAIVDKAGKPLLSWRVMILPYIEQEQLYKQFHLDEPWDSEHNKKLISQMPPIFASPVREKLAAGWTTYLVPTGPNTIFRAATGLKIIQVTDGTSNTILAFDAPAAAAVPWTKPEDWTYDPKAKEPLAGFFNGNEETLTLFADGSVQALSPKMPPETLQGLLSADGGEVVSR